jgi:hypothetical protein
MIRGGKATNAWKLRRFVLASGVLATLVLPACGGATGIDQQQTTGSPSRESVDVFGNQDVGQTFTAGLSGQLGTIKMTLSREFLPDIAGDPTPRGGAGDLSVQIRTAAGNLPGATVLASAVVPEADVPETVWTEVTVSFAAPAAVSANTQYALVLHALGPAACDPFPYNCYHYFALVAPYGADYYPRGQACLSGDAGVTWPNCLGGRRDYVFKTYVTLRSSSQTRPRP